MRRGPAYLTMPLEVISSEVDLPTSANQESRLIFEYLLRSNHSAREPFNTVAIFQIDGQLHLESLQEALNAILHRHSVLRASFFPCEDVSEIVRQKLMLEYTSTGKAPQDLFKHRILPIEPIQIQPLVLNTNDEAMQISKLKSIISTCNSHFDYSQPPLLRVKLVEIHPNRYIFILAFPHLICDGISRKVMLDELWLLYRLLAYNTNSKNSSNERLLLPNSYHFSQYTLWEQKFMSNSKFQDCVEYWIEHWKHFSRERLQRADLQISRKDGERANEEVPISICENLSPGLTEVIRKFAKARQLTPHMFFLTAFYLTLYRYTCKTRLAVWINFANRHREEFHQMVGWFSNSHLVGVDISDNPKIEELLSRVRSTLIQSIRHSGMPTGRLWHYLEGLFDPRQFEEVFISFNYLPAGWRGKPQSLPQIKIAEISLGTFISASSTWKPLEVSVADQRDHITITIVSNGVIFDETAIQALQTLFLDMLTVLLEKPSDNVLSLRSNMC